MAKSQRPALQKHIRILPEQWERIEAASADTPRTANQLLVELAMEALDFRESRGPETQVRVARASLFAAQVLARDLIGNGCEHEIEEIREFISTIVPDVDDRPAAVTRNGPPTNSTDDRGR